ncbi:transcriptional regulator NrdR [Dehalobacterium formicoaceticum]|uniref:Transcriptional repressor NrdR n=1 Tax=Dehalobacterium formicoaceticum TaxID=51515 RepID=A0ABT1Y1S5_9FIRM|nr:transcriptional regulator NrdR [Dehalobacterium formicoaceticum]MCR6544508.1 transcriptional regulator NrdR [Dehalobacterium formicoaceticum]
MRCPFCHYADSKVLESRSADEGSSIRRRRECLGCQRRFTTYEKIEERPLIVVKKDGRREFFDSKKLLHGIVKACEKRPVSYEQLEEIVAGIEKEYGHALEREISSDLIGEAVMKRLKDLDEVAYVRFASVYRQFEDVNTFIEEIQQLQKKS